MRRHAGTICVFFFAWAWAALWLQGLPFFTDDYDRWLATAATTSWPAALINLLNPWGGTDPTWGFTWRPLIVVWFKLFGLGGTSSTLFFAIKSELFAALAALMFATVRRITGNWIFALIAPLFLLTSHGVLQSLMWGGDMAVLANVCIVAAIWMFVDRKWMLAILFTLLAMQTKGNGKLLPVILLVSLIGVEREIRKRALIPVVISFVLAAPVASLFRNPKFADKAGYAWHAPSPAQSWALLFGDTFAHDAMPLSHGANLWPLGWIIVLFAAIALLVRLFLGSRPARPLFGSEKQFGLAIATWFLLAAGATASYPAINSFFQHRYAIDVLVPFAMCSAITVGWIAEQPFGMALGGFIAFAAAAQIYFGVARMIIMRESFAPRMVIADRINREMAQHKDAAVRAYYDGYIPYNYWPPLPGRDLTVRTRPELDRLPINSYALSWSNPALPDWEVAADVDGRTGALIEHFYGADNPKGYLLHKTAPTHQSRFARALKLLTSGDAIGAVRMYEALVNENPRDEDSLYNLGVSYRAAARIPDAIRTFRAVLNLRPDHPGAIANLAELVKP